MKKLVVTDKKACMACLACVEACSMAFYKEFDPDKSCIQIVQGKDGSPSPTPVSSAENAPEPVSRALSPRTPRACT